MNLLSWLGQRSRIANEGFEDSASYQEYEDYLSGYERYPLKDYIMPPGAFILQDGMLFYFLFNELSILYYEKELKNQIITNNINN